MTLASGTRLGPYAIVAPLGAGGMGDVYRAKDERLGREVAIKVLPARLASDPDALGRFEREARAVAALSHPNILAIHDFGTEAGVTYAVTELLEGATLRDRLEARPMPQAQAVDLAVQIAKGLSAAHERGIVHRDLKPENVFVSKDGHVKILDFGLAKRQEQLETGKETSAPTASGHTEPGTVMGTVGYMSPEQVRGQAVDHRSDVFSFGAVLYEMLSGRKAFKRETPGDTMAAILKEEPPALQASGREVSVGLDHVVRHCLEKDRDQRFQSARDIVFALTQASGSGAAAAAPPRVPSKALLLVAAAAILAAAGIWLVRRPQPAAAQAFKRVAVLPFENVGASEDDYFADGMADEIRSKLTSLRGVEVIARSSSTPYKKTTKTPVQIARELGVEYLLTATVRWQKSAGANRVHVIPELMQIRERAAPASKWQQSFDAALTDVFQVQSDIATRVASALGVALGAGEEKQMREAPTASLAAYDAFLKGEDLWRTNGGWNQGFGTMIPSYEQAVALDPSFALAWTRLSRARAHLYEDFPTPELAEGARAAAEKATALAPDAADTHLALGEYLYWVREDGGSALAEFDKGQKVAPDNVDLLNARAFVEGMLGHKKAADEHYALAARLDPQSFGSKQWLAGNLIDKGRNAEARKVFDEAIALDPKSPYPVHGKVLSYLREGDLAGAQSVLRAAMANIEVPKLVAFFANVYDLMWVFEPEQRALLRRLPPSAFEGEASWAICVTQACWLDKDEPGVREYAEKSANAFRKLIEARTADPQSVVMLGLSLAYLGSKDEAIREGERALGLLTASRRVAEKTYIQHQLVRIYILGGEPEKALDNLEPLLKADYNLTPAWLKIDPNFDSLRGNPRFQKLVSGSK
jgi:TolB-like protein/Tfp pilus assembly protein PilF